MLLLDWYTMCTHAHFNDAGGVDSSQPVDSTWPPLTSPNRKKDKDVFRFLSQQKDPNYTVRRQQFQMNRILEKYKHVKQVERERGREKGEVKVHCTINLKTELILLLS